MALAHALAAEPPGRVRVGGVVQRGDAPAREVVLDEWEYRFVVADQDADVGPARDHACIADHVTEEIAAERVVGRIVADAEAAEECGNHIDVARESVDLARRIARDPEHQGNPDLLLGVARVVAPMSFLHELLAVVAGEQDDWLRQSLSAAQVAKGGIVRRPLSDVEHYTSLARVKREVEKRGYHVFRDGRPVLIACNLGDFHARGPG